MPSCSSWWNCEFLETIGDQLNSDFPSFSTMGFSAGCFQGVKLFAFFSYLKTGVAVAKWSFKWGSPSLKHGCNDHPGGDEPAAGRGNYLHHKWEIRLTSWGWEFVPLFIYLQGLLYIPGSAGFLPSGIHHHGFFIQFFSFSVKLSGSKVKFSSKTLSRNKGLPFGSLSWRYRSLSIL